jgi:hypothetical protein
MDPTNWSDWKKGEDTTSGPAQAITNSRHMLGLRGDRLGALRNTEPMTLIFPTSVGANSIQAKNVFRYQGASQIYTVDTDAVSGTPGTRGFIEPYATHAPGFAIFTAAQTDITLDAMFLQIKDALFMTTKGNGSTGGKLLAWYGNISATGGAAGVEAPTGAPTVALNPSGSPSVLNSTVANATYPFYQWVAVLVDARGTKGNPSPETTQQTTPSGYATITLHAADIPVYYAGGTVEFYRRGVYLTQYYKVGVQPIVAPGSDIVFTDLVLDVDALASATIVSYNNYPPPANLDIIVDHLGRMYGADSDTLRLKFSGVNLPEQWGILESGPALEGGYLDLPGGNDDPIKTLSSTGSLLIIGRRRSIYALYGNDFTQFNIAPISKSVGVIAKRAMIRCYNDVYFLATDRRVYRVTDGNLQWISQGIQASLDAMTLAQIQSARLTFGQARLFIAFGTGPGLASDGVCFIYDFGETDEASGWTEEIIGYVTDIQAVPHPTENHDEIIVAGTAFLDGATSGTAGEVRRLFDSTSTVAKKVDYLTVEAISSAQDGIAQGETRAEILYIEGSADLTGISGGNALMVSVTADTYTRTYPIDAAHGFDTAKNTLFRSPVHPDLIGRYMQVGLSGQVKSLEVVLISLACALHRDDG